LKQNRCSVRPNKGWDGEITVHRQILGANLMQNFPGPKPKEGSAPPTLPLPRSGGKPKGKFPSKDKTPGEPPKIQGKGKKKGLGLPKPPKI
jgi:hypothetical protein